MLAYIKKKDKNFSFHKLYHILMVILVGSKLELSELMKKMECSVKFQVPKDDVRLFDKVVFEVDGSPREQIMWPRHCIQGSWGSQLHRDLKVCTIFLGRV